MQILGRPLPAAAGPDSFDLLPALRADFRVYENYVYTQGAPLDVAFSAFGGLLDEHAPAIGKLRYAELSGVGQKRGVTLAVHHVVGQAARCVKAGGQVGGGIGKAGTGGVDDHVETLPRKFGEAAAAGPEQAEAGKFIGQFGGLAGRAVGDHQAGRGGFEQWQHGAPSGPAGAQEKHSTAFDRTRLIDRDVAQNAGPIGVVAENAVRAEDQGVDRTGSLGARGVAIGQVEGLQLEGDGDVEPASANGTKGLHGGRESVEGAKEGLVDKGLAGLGGKEAMNA